MMTLKVLAALLDYPNAEVIADLPEMGQIVAAEGRLSPGSSGRLAGFMETMAGADLIDLQAEWVELFDRSRSLSLNLFEHVHGESRDRGQAMVDLLALYRAGGLEIGVSELPDYLPLFLEFLSQMPDHEAIPLLGEAAQVVAVLAERLASRNSTYAAVMGAVAELAGATSEAGQPVATPDADEDMDVAWAEEPVGFGQGAALPGCGVRHLN